MLDNVTICGSCITGLGFWPRWQVPSWITKMEKNNKSALNDGSSFFFLLISNKNMIKLTESLSGTVPKAQWECNLALSICRFCYFMYSICQISNIARSNTRHTARQPSYMRNIHVWRERGEEECFTLFDHCESYKYEIRLSNDQPVQVSFHYSKTCQSVCKINIVHKMSHI